MADDSDYTAPCGICPSFVRFVDDVEQPHDCHPAPNPSPTDAFEDAEVAREEAKDEREALHGALVNVLSNASKYPKVVQARLLGQDMGPLTDKVTDAILAAGYRKTSLAPGSYPTPNQPSAYDERNEP